MPLHDNSHCSRKYEPTDSLGAVSKPNSTYSPSTKSRLSSKPQSIALSNSYFGPSGNICAASTLSSFPGHNSTTAPSIYPLSDISRAREDLNNSFSDRRSSIYKSTKTVFFPETSMQGVDLNIYHWKVLNLSRAKLKASSRTSALLSGFAMVAMVEINIDQNVPEPILITFVVCTVLLIAVHMLALMISTCILPNVEAVANLHYQTQKTVFESPHTKMNFIVELAWVFSTVIGILLFLVELAIVCWVQFYTVTKTAAWVATGLLIPIIMVFIGFAGLFYIKLVSHKSEVYEDGLRELQLLRQRLEDNPGEDFENLGSRSNSRGHVQVV